MVTEAGATEQGLVGSGIDVLLEHNVWRARDATSAVLARMLRKHGIHFMVLFGSMATGRASGRSDADIGYAALGKRRVNPLRLFADLSSLLDSDRLDLVDLRHATPLLAREVARDGILVWAEHPDEWTEFRQKAMKEWDDVQKLESYRLRYVRQWLERRVE